MARHYEYQSAPPAAAARVQHRHQAGWQFDPARLRSRLVLAGIYLLLGGVIARLFYWQVIHRTQLQAEAESQYRRTVTHQGQRGKILTSDGYLLVSNQPVYRLYAEPHLLTETPTELSRVLAPLLLEVTPETASQPALLAQQQQELTASLEKRLASPGRKWVALKPRVSDQQKQAISALELKGINFEEYFVRDYPEASTAAHILGFVGKNQAGEDQGYFGIEGALDKELRGQTDRQTFKKDALGRHLFFDQFESIPNTDGRDVVLTIRRDIQHTVEAALAAGIERYGAAAGSVVVMNPQTGQILAMASLPSYQPATFYESAAAVHKNPVLADSFEPGSIFKVLTVAAGVDSGVITPETNCTACSGPRQIGQYTIKTWNDKYFPGITIQDGLAKSDNTAMIFIAEQLGATRFSEYLQRFGIGQPTQIELQEDTSTPFRKDWKFIDLATGSFGQGIVTTSLQMVRAVAAIANDGQLVRPTIVAKVIDHQKNTEIPVAPERQGQVIQPSTARQVAAMMEYAAQHGEAQWTRSKTHSVAGKTGTAQVPIDGHYDAEKTIASFIGFSPVDNPQFVMLVTLREPKSSPWASETAAPLWYTIANRLYLLLDIPADR